ncbi:MAG: glycosyltransferase family 2 protein, partial [Limisphaerales bacterium]
MTALAVCVFIFALIPAVLFIRNFCIYRVPGVPHRDKILPKISVLIPARNEEANIEEAIRSVQRSHGVRWELLVLDDGSTDNTAGIVRQMAASDSRIQLL